VVTENGLISRFTADSFGVSDKIIGFRFFCRIEIQSKKSSQIRNALTPDLSLEIALTPSPSPLVERGVFVKNLVYLSRLSIIVFLFSSTE
jgi:hypothetical protein